MAGLDKDMIVEKNTFGKSKACHILAQMMNDNVISIYEKHRVLSHIVKITNTFRNISPIPDKGTRERTFEMWRDFTLSKIDELDELAYPAKFKTFYKNVVFYLYRKYLFEGSNLDNRK